jgi:hypothetical protein
MITTYNDKHEPIIRLNKNATDFIVFECLDCKAKMFIENGIDGYVCHKCGYAIDPVCKANRTD